MTILSFVQRRRYFFHISTKLTEQQKFAAVDKAVPTTLPLSSIPSKNVLIMKALRPTIDSRQTPRETSEIDGQNHDEMSFLISWTTTFAFSVQIWCTAVITGESGANASLAMKDAVAPRAPLRMARLLMDMEEVHEDDFIIVEQITAQTVVLELKILFRYSTWQIHVADLFRQMINPRGISDALHVAEVLSA